MELKKITAIIRSDRLKDVENRLKGPIIPGITVDHVKGYGEYPNFFERDWMSRYARIEIVATTQRVPSIVGAIAEVVHTATEGDGIIYVVPVDQAYRIRDWHRVPSDARKSPALRPTRRKSS